MADKLDLVDQEVKSIGTAIANESFNPNDDSKKGERKKELKRKRTGLKKGAQKKGEEAEEKKREEEEAKRRKEENEREKKERQAEKLDDKKRKGSDAVGPSESKKQRMDDPPTAIAKTAAAAKKPKTAAEGRVWLSELSLQELADKGKKALSPEQEVIVDKMSKAKEKKEQEERMKRLHGQSEAVLQASKAAYLKEREKMTQADEQLAIKLQAELNQGVIFETPQQAQRTEENEVQIYVLEDSTKERETKVYWLKSKVYYLKTPLRRERLRRKGTT